MKKLYFIAGSQDLYGEETLKQVEIDARKICGYLNQKTTGIVEIELQKTALDSDGILAVMRQAECDDECVGVITWMHTFSPAKMWIKGLQALSKPLLHLHTQLNAALPYDKIDMDFMNLHQSAHGDREYSFILRRLNKAHDIAAGHYTDSDVLQKIIRFARVAKAVDFSKRLKVAMIGSNMREVAVTDGDRVESQIKYGWEVNYYGIGDVVDEIQKVSQKDTDSKYQEYLSKYILNTENTDAVRLQAKYDLGLSRFLEKTGCKAFTDTFQDLHGVEQLFGLAVQEQQARKTGFAAEGDYKTAALNAVLNVMSEGCDGACGFMEDYTYDMERGLVLSAHMLEVDPSFAANKPKIEVHPLAIGGKNPPARLVFDGVEGDGVVVCMIDLGTHFKLICADIKLVTAPLPTPKLPVGKVMWQLKPDFKQGVTRWLEEGGGHHTVVATTLTRDDLAIFAKFTDTEIAFIG